MDTNKFTIALNSTRYNEDFYYMNLTINGTPKYLKVAPEGVNRVLISLGLIELPEDRFTINSTMDARGNRVFEIVDLFFDYTVELSQDSYWDFLNSNLTSMHLSPINLLHFMTSSRVGTSADNPQEIYLLTDSCFNGLDDDQIESRINALLFGASQVGSQGEYTSSLSKPADTLPRIIMAYHRKMALLVNQDSLTDFNTFKSVLSLIKKAEEIDHSQAHILLENTKILLNTLRNLTGNDYTEYAKQLQGLTKLVFNEVPKVAETQGDQDTSTNAKNKKEEHKGGLLNNIFKTALDSHKPQASSNYDVAFERYQDSNDPVKDIVKDLGISTRTFYEEMGRRGIPRRSKKD